MAVDGLEIWVKYNIDKSILQGVIERYGLLTQAGWFSKSNSVEV